MAFGILVYMIVKNEKKAEAEAKIRNTVTQFFTKWLREKKEISRDNIREIVKALEEQLANLAKELGEGNVVKYGVSIEYGYNTLHERLASYTSDILRQLGLVPEGYDIASVIYLFNDYMYDPEFGINPGGFDLKTIGGFVALIAPIIVFGLWNLIGYLRTSMRI